MVDSKALARVVHEEALVAAAEWSWVSEPDLTPREKGDRALTTLPLPDDGALSSVLDDVFWASMLAEEGRPCRPRLVYLPSRDSRLEMHWLAKPEQLDRESLRQLLQAQGPFGHLAWSLVEGIPMITGINGSNGDATRNLVISGSDYGAVEVSWNGLRLLTFRAGDLRRLSTCALPISSHVHPHAGGFLGEPIVTLVDGIIREISRDGHGGAIEFCRRFAPAAAVVVSSDGRVLLITSAAVDRSPECAEITLLVQAFVAP